METKEIGRPRKEIDWQQIDDLAGLHCTAGEIHGYLKAVGVDVSYDTLDRRCEEEYGCSFAEKIKQKQNALAKPRLRQLQWASAEKGNVTMQIWLGKQYLGQSDKLDMTPPTPPKKTVKDLTDAELMEICIRIKEQHEQN